MNFFCICRGKPQSKVYHCSHTERLRLFAVAAVAGISLHLWAGLTDTRLNDSAETDENGKIIVLGTEGSYNNLTNCTKEAAFDGNTETFFDPASGRTERCWAGIRLRSPKMVTRIRYFGRGGFNSARMNGVLFQGANREDFSDAATLHVAHPPKNWDGTSWVDVILTNSACYHSYTYLRVYGPNLCQDGQPPNGTYGGNPGEIEFYGADLPEAAQAPAAPEIIFADALNEVMNVKIKTADPPLVYETQRKGAMDRDFRTIHSYSSFTTNDLFWKDLGQRALLGSVYRFRAYNTAGTSDWTSVSVSAYTVGKGKWIGTQGSFNSLGDVGSRLFDGDVTTFYDAHTPDGVWAGLDFGEPRTIAEIRFVPRPQCPGRALGGKFQISDSEDFSAASDIFTIATTPAPWAVVKVELPEPVRARYVRYLSPDGGQGNMAEVEFDLVDIPYAKHKGFSAAFSDLTNQHAKITLAPDLSLRFLSNLIYRATAPGGPWTCVTPEGLPRASAAWTDTDVRLGVRYYYRIAYQGERGIGPLSDEFVPFRRYTRIERSWDDLTKLKEGMSVIEHGHPWNNQEIGATKHLFDGDITTYCDLVPPDGEQKGEERAGVDLGEPYQIAFFRIYPRSAQKDRLTGHILYGATASEDWWKDGTALCDPLAAGEIRWYEQPCFAPGAYRYVFIHKPGGGNCNATELELYGLPQNALTNEILIAPLEVTLTPTESGVEIAWENCTHAETYRVERKTGDAAQWTELASGLAAPAYLDSSAVYDGTSYTYRISSVRSINGQEEVAHSSDYQIIPYVPGQGTGLNGMYFHPYSLAYDPRESNWLTRVDAKVDFNWGAAGPIPGCPAGDSGVGIIWSGELIAPFTGKYNFIVDSDGGASLRIDNAFVLNDWRQQPGERGGQCPLTRGAHRLRLDYFGSAGNAKCILKWGGCVKEDVIPTAQLLPEPPPRLPEPWLGERTINAGRQGAALVDPNSGEITITGDGRDVWQGTEEFHYLWRSASGNFDCSMHFAAIGKPEARRKIMLMIRNGLPAGSPMLAPASFYAGSHKVWGCKIRDDSTQGIRDFNNPSWMSDDSGSSSGWLRIRRARGEISFYGKSDGKTEWTEIGTYPDTDGVYSDTLLIGPAVSGEGAAFKITEFSIRELFEGTVLILR